MKKYITHTIHVSDVLVNAMSRGTKWGPRISQDEVIRLLTLFGSNLPFNIHCKEYGQDNNPHNEQEDPVAYKEFEDSWAEVYADDFIDDTNGEITISEDHQTFEIEYPGFKKLYQLTAEPLEIEELTEHWTFSKVASKLEQYNVYNNNEYIGCMQMTKSSIEELIYLLNEHNFKHNMSDNDTSTTD